jgi:AhpD family alkylhydroperoxidase
MKIDDKTKELVAIGASITANCQPCLQYHADQARRLGAANQEIAEAIEVGKQVRRGASAKMDAFSSKLAGATGATEARDVCCG